MSDKSEKDLLLDLTKNVAEMRVELRHHLSHTCSRHESEMESIQDEIKAINADRYKLYGLVIALPLICSLLGYIWVTQFAMVKLENQIAQIQKVK